jgi:hypothetical protein
MWFKALCTPTFSLSLITHLFFFVLVGDGSVSGKSKLSQILDCTSNTTQFVGH